MRSELCSSGFICYHTSTNHSIPAKKYPIVSQKVTAVLQDVFNNSVNSIEDEAIRQIFSSYEERRSCYLVSFHVISNHLNESPYQIKKLKKLIKVFNQAEESLKKTILDTTQLQNFHVRTCSVVDCSHDDPYVLQIKTAQNAINKLQQKRKKAEHILLLYEKEQKNMPQEKEHFLAQIADIDRNATSLTDLLQMTKPSV